MRPEWFDKADVPFDAMWDSDRYWFPLLLSNRHFSGRADYEREGETFFPKKWWFGVDSVESLSNS
jgi:hypothetical protein